MSEEVIVKAKPFKGFSHKKVVYIPSDSFSRILQKNLEKSAVKNMNTGFGYLFLLENKIVLYQSLGAPAAVLALEPLIVSGAKEIILLGFCGSLNSKFRTTHVVSISKALSEEGTSKHYFSRKKMFRPSSTLKNNIESRLYAQNLPFLTGSVTSTDAPYRETKSWLKKKQKRGIDLVDMETSAVFALAEFYNIQAAALLIISDALWSGRWKKRFHKHNMEEKIKTYFLPFTGSSTI